MSGRYLLMILRRAQIQRLESAILRAVQKGKRP
jgi:hypothetical protein